MAAVVASSSTGHDTVSSMKFHYAQEDDMELFWHANGPKQKPGWADVMAHVPSNKQMTWAPVSTGKTPKQLPQRSYWPGCCMFIAKKRQLQQREDAHGASVQPTRVRVGQLT
ncbi:hypothetical protein SRHO_G00301060 [Serrasalmus rhombeus]